ncbi:hypothetical protein HMPREF9333_00351 [Johnsonella ignava ATCC 51276]|uniref:Glycosyl transferase family 1 domain-containing protein n=1 Tax=Johnsonella ignava ATCC 51276 TaxID=679200 RepID=G5GFL2_9FIRM|nr:glycosyltransferase family 4 protein [Johnsonella ignava]EHI56489.1 hypothetical protein HMPREF9333_00351 [Johnsonella ignava ATCC 51276]
MIEKNIKTIIKYLIPINILRFIKYKLVQKKIDKIGRMHVLPYDNECYPYGINIIGPIGMPTGLGQSCRLLTDVVSRCNIDYIIKDFSVYDYKDNIEKFLPKISEKLIYSINLIHVNMNEIHILLKRLGETFLDKRYNIAFWLWEMENFPKEWVPLINIFDEIWTPSDFISSSLKKVTNKPVLTMPYAVTAEYDAGLKRSDFNLPEDKFLFLMMYDSNSIRERKNPKSIIKAFKSAFKKTQDVGLVLKISNISSKELNELKDILKGYDIYFISEVFEKKVLNSLIRLADVYVSLHRAEGFGLVLAEAMLLGTPTIATDYSSNTEFQNYDSACMVGYDKVPVGRNIYPYKKNDLWAEPHVSEAAAFMLRLYEDREFYNSIKITAQKHIKTKTDIESITLLVSEHLGSLKKLS